MGCDIHPSVEILVDGVWKDIDDLDVFNYRSYGLFGFLADVRNYSQVPPIQKGRGFPKDSPRYKAPGDDPYTDWEDGFHSAGYVTLAELMNFDYNQTFEDRRRAGDTLPTGLGATVTFREFLGECFFEDLYELWCLGVPFDNVRVLFEFDS